MKKDHGTKWMRAVAAVWLPLVLANHTSDVSAGTLESTSHDKNRVRFIDIAKRPGSGITYRRTRSSNDALWASIRSKPKVPIFDFPASAPVRSRGVPGVAVFDYDRDGDLDIYVTNGPGTPNSLYSSQFAQGRGMTFVDVATVAGVDATQMDSTGVCFGDIDNDGDADLYVLGLGETNKLFVNNGKGAFSDVTADSEIGGRPAYSTSCSMGDVNGDGLLDIVVAHTTTSWNNPSYPTDHNQLFLNEGSHRFRDISDESGITTLAGFPPQQAGAAGLTWAIAMVDYDLDSDIDIVMGDDLSAYPVGGLGGTPGYVHVMQNDGTGKFKDVTVEAGMNVDGAWMGFSFGDVNSDGYLDMFVTNIGDYMNAEYFPYGFGDRATRMFYGQADSSFRKQEITSANATAFGWGTVMDDFDNDGDTDIFYRGGMDGGPLVDASNPGLMLWNDGNGNMTLDERTVGVSGDLHRNVQGLARGDLNNDGFPDLVSVSDFDIPRNVLTPYSTRWGAGLDDIAYFAPAFAPVGPLEFSWNGHEFPDGTLAVEINNSHSRNGAVSVELMGTVGLLNYGRSNRDGVGATVSFTPRGGKRVMSPVVAGDSYASQNSLTSHFGLGKASKGTIDVLWPGGTRNRLYNVKSGENIRFPEIPCSYRGDWRHIEDYKACITKSLRTLVSKGVLDSRMKQRLYESAIFAFFDSRQRADDSQHH